MAVDELVIRAALRDELSGPLGEVRDELRRAGREVDTLDRKAGAAGRTLASMSSGVDGLARKLGTGLKAGLTAGVVGIGALTAAAGAASVSVVSLAMDAGETASKFATVFGPAAAQVDGELGALSSRFGLVQKDLQDAASGFAVFAKAAGLPEAGIAQFSTDLTKAGLDLASFWNVDQTEAFSAISSGLSGEAEPLRKFGIFISEASMKATAATMGLTGELTEQQKVAVRSQIILKGLGDAEGDIERTSGSLANQWRGLKGRGVELATALGNALLPAATGVVTALNDRLGPAVDRLEARVPQLTARIGEFSDKITTAGGNLSTAWDRGGLDAAVISVDSMTGSGGKLVDAWREVKSIGSDVAAVLTGALIPGITDAAAAVDPAWLSPLGAARAALGFLADNATALAPLVTGLVLAFTAAKIATVAWSVATTAHNIATGIATTVTTVRAGVTALLTGSLITAATAEGTRSAAIAAGIGLQLRMAAAMAASTVKTIASTAATIAARAASMAARGAVLAWTAAQWLLNAALSANPLGLVVIAIAALAAGVVIAYRKSETFRGIVDGLWKGLRSMWEWAGKAATAVKDKLGAALDKLKLPSWLPGVGDTATSRARGGNLGGTLAAHAALDAGVPGRRTISNALVGGGGRGHGSGDHQAGRALDVVGTGLGAYGRAVRAAGGYAAMHGAGASRHLHVVPPQRSGDTATSRVRLRPSSPTGMTPAPVVLSPGAIVVNNPASTIDLEAAIRDALEAYQRDQLERA